MIVAKCVKKIRTSLGKITGYWLQDGNGQSKFMNSDKLKDAIRAGQIKVTNLTLTKDGRLVDSKEDINVNTNNSDNCTIEKVCDYLGFEYIDKLVTDRSSAMYCSYKDYTSPKKEIMGLTLRINIIVKDGQVKTALQHENFELTELTVDMCKSILNKMSKDTSYYKENVREFLDILVKLSEYSYDLSETLVTYLIREAGTKLGIYNSVISYLQGFIVGLKCNTEFKENFSKTLRILNERGKEYGYEVTENDLLEWCAIMNDMLDDETPCYDEVSRMGKESSIDLFLK